jgi:V8-like Glu-specific endopeptidase
MLCFELIWSRMKLLSLLLFGMLLITACSQGGNNKRITNLPELEIQTIMNLQNMDCASLDGKPCPIGVARLLIVNPENNTRSSVCSGFLVNEDTLVTNEHCISSQAVCDNTYVAIYNGHSHEQTKCLSVVKILNDYDDAEDPRKKLDVAIVKLADKFHGQTFKLATTKPKLNEVVTAWVIDHTGLDQEIENKLESRVTQLNCTVSENALSASLWLNNCPTISGNSGSPVVNSKGEVIGIVWGGNRQNDYSLEDLDVRRASEDSATVTEVVYFRDFISSN